MAPEGWVGSGGAEAGCGWPPAAGHYEVLGVPYGASQKDIRRAYRLAAQRHHPDKGGTAAAFARVQAAWEVLGEPRRRAVYDACAHDYLHHYVPQDVQRSSGGEGVLLAELHHRCAGAVVASCQLVVTCELCGRPATRDCSVCGMPFCSFCARRQHWRGDKGLHWPLVVASGSMMERLGRREMELKRLEDDRRLAAADPHHRSEAQLRELRAFNEAAALAAARPDAQVTYDPALARLYMWTQTEHLLLLACHLPNGRHDRELQLQVEGGVLRLGVEGGAPVVVRRLAGALEPTAPTELHRTADGRFALLVLTKASAARAWIPPGADLMNVEPHLPTGAAGRKPGGGGLEAAAAPPPPPAAWPWRAGGSSGGGSWWRQVFVGDSDGARCLPPPYSLTQLPDEVVLELPLPWWVRSEDVHVDVGCRQLQVAVRGVGLSLVRSYWWNSAEAARRPSYQPVVPERSSWTLGEDEQRQQPGASPAAVTAAATSRQGPGAAGGRRAGRCLTVTLERPDLTEEERVYKKGVRQDNRTAGRAGGGELLAGDLGVRFFQEDEDAFELEPLLQAASFQHAGGAWVMPRPWQHEDVLAGRWVTAEEDLPSPARAHLAMLRRATTATAAQPPRSQRVAP